MAPPPSHDHADPEPFAKAIRSFGPVFWIANWMELVERFAYYGVRVVLPVFMVASFEAGGPQLTHIQKGTIYAIWALVQSFVPIFTGGFADRYGYRLNIGIATVLKILGYLVMGSCIIGAEALAGMPLAEARALGIDRTYEIFFAGSMLLALGTAVFKPGLQGLIAARMPKRNASLGWALFYQMVNIGGFLGPVLAGYLRVLDWTYVFAACAAAISLNFLPLFFIKEPEHEGAGPTTGPLRVLWDAARGLLEPRLFFFTISFAGFWLMFYQLFDILPNFIDDWIDSRSAAQALQGILGEAVVPLVNGGNLTQEWMINANAALISVGAFAVGYLTGKLRSLTAIILGIGIAAVAILGLGASLNGWWVLACILLFSVGEMSASPTKMRYLASIAPPGKEGLYMGYVNMTVGIGWSIGSIIAGELYQKGGDKIVLARRYLVEHTGLDAATITAMPRGEVLAFFEKTVGVDAWGTRQVLWDTYHPGQMWSLFTAIGVGSLCLIIAYTWLIRRADATPGHSLDTQGHLWVRAALVPIAAALWGVFLYKIFYQQQALEDALALAVQAVMFSMLFVVSFFPDRRSPAS